jgi:hypothetical protein
MRNLIPIVDASKVVTIGLAAYSSSFIYAATPQEVCINPCQPHIVRSLDSTIIVDESIRRAIRFQALVSDWHQERGVTSSVGEMCSCPAYLSIVAMGPSALPLIIAKLREEGDDPDHWFVALYHITERINPIPEEDMGDMRMMAKAWLDWAESELDVR